ncbi:Yip1-domain-containing protein [Mycena olivaceomarginata]|nr:Yip1-domain-containing protein [Mycena olivaceomarginata]
MAYVAIDGDERLEEGPEGLQFKSFLGDAGDQSGGARSPGLGNADRGYLQDAGKPSGGFWTVEYYQCYFDVDTKTVLRRCYGTLLPSADYLSTYLSTGADLYGPFWTLTTLIFALFLSSSLAASITAYLGGPLPPTGSDSTGATYDYDFGLLSVAVPLVYSYGLALPVLLWGALRYLGVGEWSVVEAVAVWGYGMFVWIPVSILAVIPEPTVRWTLVGIAFGLSGYFLVRNVYPILASADAKATRLLIILIAALHAGLAISFKVLFFSYYIIAPAVGDAPAPAPTATVSAVPVPEVGAGNETTAAVVEVVRRVFG